MAEEKQSDIPLKDMPDQPDGHLRQSHPKHKAAGVPAVLVSLEYMLKYMSPADAWKAAFALNQKGGFDCPGCAWPDPDDERSSIGEYCENGIKAIAEEAQKKTVRGKFFKKHSVKTMLEWSDFELGKKGRLAEPVWLREGASHYEPISWEDAFRLIAAELNALADPNEAIFYTVGKNQQRSCFCLPAFCTDVRHE
jgi:anaerobic selenocysteine-containing dehydrogenase